LSPEPMDNVMWAMLIMGFVGFWMGGAANGSAKK
jgi:hypothetical protein